MTLQGMTSSWESCRTEMKFVSCSFKTIWLNLDENLYKAIRKSRQPILSDN